MERVSLVVSPESPFKQGLSTSAEERLDNARDAIRRSGLPIEVSDIEFHLEPPYYTINTLRAIRKNEPEREHILVMGADNLNTLSRWHEWKALATEFEIWVYPREGFDSVKLLAETLKLLKNARIKLIDAPLVDISSTQIREAEARGEDMSKWKV